MDPLTFLVVAAFVGILGASDGQKDYQANKQDKVPRQAKKRPQSESLPIGDRLSDEQLKQFTQDEKLLIWLDDDTISEETKRNIVQLYRLRKNGLSQ